ncbi:MAG: hypothetical protein KAH31_12200, partial [Candidatus Sabulitectum sp.]|nr:hypothetical protein [Candidatus Sabulitectum sp.]
KDTIGEVSGVAYLEIPGDLFEIWDIASETDSIVFLDAVAGEVAGLVTTGKTLPRAMAPSFHQSDLCTVVESLASIYQGEYPQWTLWGVTIDPPQVLGEGLSETVALAVEKAVLEITALLQGDGLAVGDTLVRMLHSRSRS